MKFNHSSLYYHGLEELKDLVEFSKVKGSWKQDGDYHTFIADNGGELHYTDGILMDIRIVDNLRIEGDWNGYEGRAIMGLVAMEYHDDDPVWCELPLHDSKKNAEIEALLDALDALPDVEKTEETTRVPDTSAIEALIDKL